MNGAAMKNGGKPPPEIFNYTWLFAPLRASCSCVWCSPSFSDRQSSKKTPLSLCFFQF